MEFKTLFLALALSAVSTASAVPQTAQIVGGVAATAGEFPFIVSLQRSGSHFCGGSLLNSRTVLTAGHCAVGMTPSTLRVRAGSLNRGSGGTLVGVSSIGIHPNFSSSTLDSDVAIFKLSTAIPASSTIGYATLPGSGNDPVAGSTVTVAGWGTTSEGGSSPALLRKVDIPVVSRTQCRADYSVAEITNNMWCAGLAAGGKDSCQGDSGGPIIDTASRVLLGAVSWGEGCARAGAPGVYARIGTLLSWITSNL
ncbi:trypsin-like cysteine/serine peptidase domain-containing protein [Massariosphaeria phaeospora]|uniref:Trypsin-like cysteine/serine peptidase domain-containing protein n=1 Tax=Massariosphaeria phaeospora TaxID=100035 RepID=A0A7C8M2X4_9PLEO|nr:trypsin-like cysteine/serine peptidase domain-containing protein [Massariosphaeria phaeospora]